MRYYKYILVLNCLRLFWGNNLPIVLSVNPRFISARKTRSYTHILNSHFELVSVVYLFLNAFCPFRYRLMAIVCDLWMLSKLCKLWVSCDVWIDIKCTYCYNDITLRSHKLIFDVRINSQIFYIVPYLKDGQYSVSISSFRGR